MKYRPCARKLFTVLRIVFTLGTSGDVLLEEATVKEALAVSLLLSASQVGCFCPENEQ